MNKEYKAFLDKYGAIAERLARVGFQPFGFDPGILCRVIGTKESLNLSEVAAKRIAHLVTLAYPDTVDDAEMVAAWHERHKDKL